MQLVHNHLAIEALSSNRAKTVLFATVLMLAMIPVADAGTTGAAFQTFYNFIYQASTGYLGRGIALTGGVIGLGMGAATGKALPAAIGIVLAIFGALGPAIVNSIFASAVV